MLRGQKRREEPDSLEVLVRLVATHISARMAAEGAKQNAIACTLSRAGMSAPAIAAVLGTRVNTITKAVSRARQGAGNDPGPGRRARKKRG
jgi:DNA-directed RNA polymerase specialized sigma24 family protein